MAYDCASDGSSSPLSSVPPSVLSVSPSPPPEFAGLPFARSYPSPSSSQRSSAKTSPAPENMAPTPPSGEDDCSPPRKKRKLADPKPRTTERLDLSLGDVDPSERPQLERLLKALHKKRKIVVIAGAGISVSAGIPDFRSSGGLFNSLRKQHKLKSSGKDLFDASVYQDDSSTSSFHDMVRSLSQKTKGAEPTAFHHLIATLAQEGRLLRLYSQNVDGIDTSLPPLETKVPLPKKGPFPKTIQLHGGLDYMVCSKCHALSQFDAEQFKGPVPPACGNCTENDQVRQVAEKRSHGIGRLRPRMVLYNEHNPDDEAIGSCASLDLRTRPDAVIVAGTTLKVPGVRRIAREMCAVVRDRRDGVTIWINNDPEPMGKDLANCWDLVVKGPCDEVARYAAMRKWDDPTDYKEVTAEELGKIREDNKAKVVVVSPKKSKAVGQVQGQLVTPAASPRIAPQQPTKQAPTEDPSTPSKAKGKKRKSGVMQETVAVVIEKKGMKAAIGKAPAKKQQTQAKKPTSKGKVKNDTKKITDQFRVSKQKLKPQGTKDSKNNKDTKDNIVVSPTKPLTRVKSEFLPKARTQIKSEWIQYRPSNVMAPISPQAARNNTSPPFSTPVRPKMEPFTSPISSPLSSPPESVPTGESRPSTANSRNGGTITPTGAIPINFGHLIDTEPV
ncbi:DHS-like NAD/FAD-binding domain-containing protein [Zopfia rhizophila CBS 207.26]|uniref:DHS-like NAD/FAD-binding domain-containing protein n=1 Tax=Zopfia rhizophila CBS 207.26 TaxID=1314779 RepID=A0A6A6DSZ8_9PEZI|nr:DHS-like NAD/FAD-binding domain-containing protein [Zopfia rhizophila CBS 207.26]